MTVCRPFELYEDLIKIKCKCGHTLMFVKNHSAICKFCGKRVYPSEKSKFKEEMEIILRRKNNEQGTNTRNIS